MSAGSTNVVVIPKRRQRDGELVVAAAVEVADATTWSPASSRVMIATACAASPLAVARAPTPPSRLAIRSSNTAVVGFMIRV